MFDNTPDLVSTDSVDAKWYARKKESKCGELSDGDVIVLATDALAKWFIESADKGEEPWRQISNFPDRIHPLAFRSWTDEQRRLKRLGNDDVTFLRIEIRSQ